MTHVIDQNRLKAAAEQLEQVLKHSDQPGVERIQEALNPLILKAKSGLISKPMDRQEIPSGRDIADGTFRDLKQPDVEEALISFSTELRGGLSERERRLIESVHQLGRPQ